MRTPQDAYERLTAHGACGRAVRDSVGRPEQVWFVGGAVRDAFLGREPREIDLVTTADLNGVIGGLGEVAERHDRFGTARTVDGGCRFDIARARTETYPEPGSLPEVRFTASVEEDLRRRDFTVNAIALRVSDGALAASPGALEDLAAGVLRVLHPGSFADDPTRMWRMVRYSVRLGFKPEAEVDAGLLQTVSGDRIGAELRLALAEPDPLATLHALANAGLAPLRIDPEIAGAALEIAPPGARADLMILGCSLNDDRWVSKLGFTAAELDVIRRCIQARPAPAGSASEIAGVLRPLPDEAVAVAGARGDRASAERWLLELKHVRLEIDGDDLLAAGLQPGPEIGERLARALAAKLDGVIAGRDEELAEALR